MDIVQIVVIGIIATILTLTIKRQVPEISLIISISAIVIIFFMVVPMFSAVITLITNLSGELSTNTEYISIVMRIVGIAYIAELGASICQDAGESAIASKIEFGGKILIMVVSAPILLSLVELISNIIP